MSTHKHFNIIACVVLALTLLLTVLFINGEKLGIQRATPTMGYENRLFNPSTVHTIDIVMDDWDNFIETCENEEYAACAVVIDGEAYKNVGLRAKGNTSLSTVSSMGSNRYSFKIEFDQYDNTNSYYGLDKLSLNNLIQDTTCMKDYLTYQLMRQAGAAAPLCSYAYITVNREDWGLYLAVEAVEESFLQRNYGTDYGELYKPDSMNFGGGRGNGQAFDMDNFIERQEESPLAENETPSRKNETVTDADESTSQGNIFPQMPNNAGFTPPQGFVPFEDFEGFEGIQPPNFTPSFPTEGNVSETPFPFNSSEDSAPSDENPWPNENTNEGRFNMGNMPGGMGSSDVKLQYIDDDPGSYSNIFSNAKTDITQADQARLIAALKTLNESETPEDAVWVEEVIRYFVVHNFVCNGDSYTGSMIHNYYLYEKSGKLAMLPWDYNLAFGTFQGNNATAAVNDPIDSPLSSENDDRPILQWIFENEAYTALYHEYFAQFLENTDFASIIDSTAALIAPYIEKDPTAFYTQEEFETGVDALKTFCQLREQSVQGQLEGRIPSTAEDQSADSSTLIDASQLTLSAMGSMNRGGQPPTNFTPSTSIQPQKESNSSSLPAENSSAKDAPTATTPPSGNYGMQRPQNGQQPFASGPSAANVSSLHASFTPSWGWIVLSSAILAAALIFAWCFKRRK